MGLTERFQAYADAFEVVVENDDWSQLDPYFTEDAVYEILADAPLGGRHEGRQAVYDYLKLSLAGFDRRFDSRELEVLGEPIEDGDSVTIRWRVTYTAGAAPPLAMEGEETATFAGDRICRLEDRFAPEGVKEMNAWMAAHGDQLAR